MSKKEKKSEGKKLLWSILVVFVLTFIVQFLAFRGWLAGPEGKVLDLLLILRPSPETGTVHESRILTVEIDDDEYDTFFKKTSPLGAGRVISIVQALAQCKPRVIGVDILTDTKEYKSAPSKFPDLMKVIWIAGAEEQHYQPVRFDEWLCGRNEEFVVRPSSVLGYEPGTVGNQQLHWGLPFFARDEDLGLRRLSRQVRIAADPAHTEDPSLKPSWASSIACAFDVINCQDKSTGKDDGVYVHYGAKPPPERYRLRDLLSPAPKGNVKADGKLWNAFQDRAKDNIVLLGGTFSSARDFYETPNGRLPGLIVNAYAIRTEMEHLFLNEDSRPFAVGLDLFVGIFLVLIFATWEYLAGKKAVSKSLRWPMALSLIPFAMAFAFAWKGWPQYIPGFIGVGLCVLVHQLYEIWFMNPDIPHHRS